MIDEKDTPPLPGVSADTSAPGETPVDTGTPIWVVVAIAAVISIGSSYVTWSAVKANPPAAPVQVVVVDMAKLAVAKAFSTASTGEAPELSAKKFLTDIDKVTDSYTKAGVLVINSQAAFNQPVGVDVTALYAKALGVDLTKK